MNLTERHAKQCSRVLPFDSLTELPPHVQEQLAHLKRGVHNILALYYGGTLGMHLDDRNQLVPTDDAAELLAPLKLKGLDALINVVWFPVTDHAIDSTNARWVHWVTIANAIRLMHDMVDGFVICGGTDTKAYLLDAMHYIFPNIGKPIIATGSQKPMIELGDDATRNIFFALAAACSDLSGAHLAFADVLRHGQHIFKVKDRAFQAFDCPPRHVIGEFDGEVHLFPSAPRRNPLVTADRLEFLPQFREGAKVTRLSPATASESILHDAKDPLAAAMLLITFGAGNVRDEAIIDGELTHIDCMRMLHQQGFPVVLGSPMMDGVVDSPYATGAKAVSADVGGISGGDTCGPALEVKMMRCLASAWDADKDRLDYPKFRAEMLRNHVGELTSHDIRPRQKFETWLNTKPTRPAKDET